MVFEYGMGESVTSRTMRADNYALSEETKRLRDGEQARIADDAYADALMLCEVHREWLERLALALLDRETLDRSEVKRLLSDVAARPSAGAAVGVAVARMQAPPPVGGPAPT
jgi:cell division protease FtsH